MSDEMNRRMQILEEKSAFQEKTIDALNDVIIDQQTQLDLLKEHVRELRQMMTAFQQHPPDSDEPPPPHY